MTPDGPKVPDKPYFKIGEVSEIAGVEPHVIRYWESEFKIIKPNRTSTRQRLYRKVDVENFLIIKKLLYEEGYKIPGARKYLAGHREQGREREDTGSGSGDKDFFGEVKSELLQLKKILEQEDR